MSRKISEHRYDIRISESCVDPNPLIVERQDPDNFYRFQTRERCALEISAYVFKLNSGILRSTGRFALLSSSDDCSVKKTFSIFALSVLSEYMSPFTLNGGMDEVWLGLIKVFIWCHDSCVCAEWLLQKVSPYLHLMSLLLL